MTYDGKTELYDGALRNRLSFKDLFRDTFKPHSIGAAEKLLTVGVEGTTLPPQRMIRAWDRPWLYMRVLMFGVVFIMLANMITLEETQANLGEILKNTLPVFVAPLTLLTFFWEINIPRNISIFRVVIMFVIGGMLSLIAVPFFGSAAFKGMGSQYAAFTEEPAKLLITATFIYLMNPKYIFNGLLIGAAIGGGFGAFESFGYVVTGGDPIEEMIARSANILGAHLMWAAIEGGALVMVKGDSDLDIKHFIDTDFLTFFAISICLHFIGNFDEIHLFAIPFLYDFKYVLTSAVAIYAGYILINKAIAQVVREANGSGADIPPTDALKNLLIATDGPLKGMIYPLGDQLTIGRDPNSCNVVLPADTPGVSRRHCSIVLRADGAYIMDHGSTSGTFLQSGERIPINTRVKIDGGFYLGSRAVAFVLKN